MKILLVSALFPPDVADPAPYIKELSARLGALHQVSVLTYGTFPEVVPGVTMITVSKRQGVMARLWQFVKNIQAQSKKHDVVIVHNAPSTELPLLIASLFSNGKLFLMESDKKIHYSGWRNLLHQLVLLRVPRLQIEAPPPRPEIHPFKDREQAKWDTYEQTWHQHLSALAEAII